MTHRKNVPAPEHNQHSQVLKKLKKWFHLTHQMKRQNDVPVPAHNQHYQVHKIPKKSFTSLHLKPQMTHGLTYHWEHNSASVSWLAEMAVTGIILGLFNKKYSTRFLPLSPSLVKGDQMTVYKMAALTGMAYSLSLNSSTI
ncbi:MAG: hypothetical protein ACJ751_17740 [Niastella sp.]|uniref:hypothetical protein n=1 Tax=Niastella sp. TaxID=1869183 RepID=UPI00389AB003